MFPRLSLVLAAALSLAAPAAAEPSHVGPIPVGDRQVEVSVWEPEGDWRGVILFGHGFNGNPDAYDRLLTGWAEAGYLVYAPLFVDSLKHPDHAAYTPQTATQARIETLMTLRGMFVAHHEDLPVILAGHSFGSMMSLLGGGATSLAGTLDGLPVAGVIAFSSAGALPQFLGTDPYAGLDVPMLMITGTADTVPGFVTDWHDHRLPFDTSVAGDKYLAILDGADHNVAALAEPRDAASLSLLTRLFLDAYAGGDAGARATLAKLDNSDRMRFEKR